MQEKISELETKLRKCYSKETAFYKNKEAWNNHNPTCGQCAITALIVQEYFGGTIHRIRVNENETHYFNIIDKKIIDLTKEQFNVRNIKIIYDENELTSREEILKSVDTVKRYNILKERIKNVDLFMTKRYY